MHSEIIQRIEKVSMEAEKFFSLLATQQIKWKPAPENWCIAECLQHLIVSNESYFPVFEKLRHSYQPGRWERYNPFSRTIGKSMVLSLGSDVSKKFKAPKIFLPSNMNTGDNILKDFLHHQSILLEKMQFLSQQDPVKTVITSPVSPLITFTLGDCLTVIAGHEERHLSQALRLLKASDFPVS